MSTRGTPEVAASSLVLRFEFRVGSGRDGDLDGREMWGGRPSLPRTRPRILAERPRVITRGDRLVEDQERCDSSTGWMRNCRPPIARTGVLGAERFQSGERLLGSDHVSLEAEAANRFLRDRWGVVVAAGKGEDLGEIHEHAAV